MTTGTTWTDDELTRIGDADELDITPNSPDGSPGRPTPIWVVRMGNDLYVRSWRGDSGRWYQRARASREGRVRADAVESDVRFVEPDPTRRDPIDQAYRSKYGRHGDDVLFGEGWERAPLSPRDRSLITVAALLTGGNAEQLTFHLQFAKDNGVTEDELIEAITHLAFYAGWPKAMSAMSVAKQVFRGN
jgi:4-carboxymuconolactone decarboxylase